MQFIRKDGTPAEFIIIPARANGETIYFELIGKTDAPFVEDGTKKFKRILIQKVYPKED